MKKRIHLFFCVILALPLLLLVSKSIYAQDAEECYCSPMKMYIYDTKINFPLDEAANAIEAGKFTRCPGLSYTDQKNISVEDHNLVAYWHFTFTATQSSIETWKSANEDHVKKSDASGTGSMVIDAPPAVDGDVIINTEQGDPVISSTVSGDYNYYESDIKTGVDKQIDEKRIINYTGKPSKSQGLLFEYNSKDKDDQGGIEEAGISFDITGTSQLWNRDADGKLRNSLDHDNEKNWAQIGLGHKEDKVTRIKNGFAIDYTLSTDKTFPGVADGTIHRLSRKEQYHAELTRK